MAINSDILPIKCLILIIKSSIQKMTVTFHFDPLNMKALYGLI